MVDTGGKNIVIQLRKKWAYKVLLSRFFLLLGIVMLVCTISYKLFALPAYTFLTFLVILIIGTVIISRRSRLTDLDVSRYLNSTMPSVEESTQLVLAPASSLNFLEQLQARKVENELLAIQKMDPFKKRFTISLLTLLLASFASFALFKISFVPGLHSRSAMVKQVASVNSVPEKLLPEIKSANIFISPPAYTGRSSRQQSRFNLLVEEGAVVSWHIQTNIPAKEVEIIFNDGLHLLLSKDAGQINWRTQKQVNRTGFYQVKIDDNLSELYKIETVKDLPPTVVVQAPKPTTYINYGQSETVLVKGVLADDYGMRSAHISATISSGQGEGVKFKEQKLSLASFKPGQRYFQLQSAINCKALGMHPGDELYFFISSIDNHNQETRSEVYIITLQDTTSLTGMNGMVAPLDVKIELFRSQRQIIIETELLLKNKPRISAEEFVQKSNDLGVDQKLLRMRYGKFLGEETDVEIGGDHTPEGESHTTEVEDIMDQYSHQHDKAEDANFFDAETKKQLKATLAEMWSSEVKLRTILPKEALPFEYKALALLKELQQKSRVYVAKTGLKTTPLQLEKRLSGDLSKINQPIIRETLEKPETATNLVGKALGELEELRANGILNLTSKEILQKAFYQLSIRAANEPSIYIPSLSALKKILNDKYRLRDITDAQHGLQKMAASAEKLPYPGHEAAKGLSKQYFNNLKKANK